MSTDRLLNARPLESALFRVQVATATIVGEQQVDALIAEARDDGTELVVVRVPTEQIGVIQTIEARGGRLCDVLVTFSRVVPAGGLVANVDSDAWHVRPSGASDAMALRRLVPEAFRNFAGHWHADARLARKDADQLYGRWASDLANRSGPDELLMIVEDSEGELAGFLAVGREADGWGVPLAAVLPRFRGNGLLRLLLVAASRAIARGEASRLNYETQVTNWSAISVVSRCGFAPRASRATLHLWTRDT